MKLMKGKFVIGLALLALGMTSCKDDVVFDQANYDRLVKASFPVENVDPSQDWATVGTAQAEVSINLDYDVTYDVGLYLDNPIGTATATRVYEKKVKSGESFTTAFSYKLASPVVYVGIFDPEGRGMAQAVKIENGRAVADINTNITASARHRASEDASVYGQYVKTVNEYLNPAGTAAANQITVAGMQQYEAFTNADIDAANHIFGTNTNASARKRTGRRAGEDVAGDAYFKVAAGDNYADGEVKNIYYGSTLVGTIQFGGSDGGAATASASGDYTAKIYRRYYIFTPLVDNGNQIYFEHESKASSNVKVYLKDETDGSILIGQWGVTWQNNLYAGLTAGHVYKVYFEDNSLMGFWGLKYHFQGKTMAGGGSGDSGSGSGSGDSGSGSGSGDSGSGSGSGDSGSGSGSGDSGSGSGGYTGYTKGDGHHYRVAAGTEVTKHFDLTSPGGYNDIVVYVEGKLHLNGNTLDGPTLVVANGGEIVIDGNTQMSNAGRIVVLAGGKITSTQNVYFNVNNGSPCYNAGAIQMTNGELNVNGSDFYNASDGTVKVNSLRNTSGGKFTNFGTIEATTNTIQADAYNCEIINGCHMKFTEDAGVGGITMLDNSRLDVGGRLYITGKEAWGQGRNNTLYNYSVINAGSIYFQDAAFIGPTATGEFAIVKTAKELVSHANDLNSYNNVYWDIDRTKVYNYNNEEWDINNVWTAAWHILNNGDWCTSGITNYVSESTATSNFSIPAGKCTGAGYNPDGNPGGGKPDAEDLSFRFMFEDNYPDAGDYDFNDCVFKVTPVLDENNAKKVTVTVNMEATGASKTIGAAIRLVGVTASMLSSHQCTQALPVPPANVGEYKNIPDGNFATSQDPNDRSSLVMLLCKDVHYALNPSLNNVGGISRYFYNTPMPGWTNYGQGNVATATFVFEFNKEADAQRLLDQATYDAFIVEPYNGTFWEVHTVQNNRKGALVLHYNVHESTYDDYQNAYINGASGNLPWAVMVPGTVEYPLEGRNVTVAYPDFTGWAQNHTTNTNWYDSPAAGNTFPLSLIYK